MKTNSHSFQDNGVQHWQYWQYSAVCWFWLFGVVCGFGFLLTAVKAFTKCLNWNYAPSLSPVKWKLLLF